ncbi:MAG TPA: hypothetical protein VHA56_15320 [Mucilaginibacter sp.]|nr:hypothetical protein [Mucilaginibacter sp.]
MKKFNEHDTVIYTDEDGRLIDTFVIYKTDELTGLTHINHENLKVTAERLSVHPKTIEGFHLPMNDAFSFEIFKKLKEKYEVLKSKPVRRELRAEPVYNTSLAKAS